MMMTAVPAYLAGLGEVSAPFASMLSRYERAKSAYASCQLSRAAASRAIGSLRVCAGGLARENQITAEELALTRSWFLPQLETACVVAPRDNPALEAALGACSPDPLTAGGFVDNLIEEWSWVPGGIGVQNTIRNTAAELTKPLFALGSFQVKPWHIAVVGGLVVFLAMRDR